MNAANRNPSLAAALALLAGASSLPAFAADADDPAWVRGRTVFSQCRGCHTIDPRQSSLMKGPGLWGIIGRPAGSLPGYAAYSLALQKSGITWDAGTLDGYLASPGKFIPGNNMAFIGLPKAEDRQAVIVYLTRSAPAPVAAQPAQGGEEPVVLTLKKAN